LNDPKKLRRQLAAGRETLFESPAMIIRYALFEGTIHQGREAEFRAFVKERLVPLWAQFPGAEEVRVLDGTDRDEGAPVYAMALAIRYPDMETCNKALASSVRVQSREVTGELLKLFTGKVHHHVFEANEYATGSGN
jgi:hypothetical protein